MRSVVVVGGGMAGLACASRLVAEGLGVVLFDNGHAVGGRVATRIVDDVTFNHGAQFVAARDGRFAGLLQRLFRSGLALPWPAAGEGRWTGVPGMAALATGLVAEAVAGGLELALSTELRVIERDASWRLVVEGKTPDGGRQSLLREAEMVLLAIPAVRAAKLLRDVAPHVAARLDGVAIASCWTLLLAFDMPLDAPDVLRPDTGPIGWAARDSARPGAPPGPERWVVQAGPEWSRAWLDRTPDDAEVALLAAFAVLVGMLPTPRHRASFLWREARTERPLGEACLWDAELGVGVCGDWCLGARVEAAWLSGDALASRVLGDGAEVAA